MTLNESILERLSRNQTMMCGRLSYGLSQVRIWNDTVANQFRSSPLHPQFKQPLTRQPLKTLWEKDNKLVSKMFSVVISLFFQLGKPKINHVLESFNVRENFWMNRLFLKGVYANDKMAILEMERSKRKYSQIELIKLQNLKAVRGEFQDKKYIRYRFPPVTG